MLDAQKCFLEEEVAAERSKERFLAVVARSSWVTARVVLDAGFASRRLHLPGTRVPSFKALQSL